MQKDIAIREITDIEENVWSPRFGSKGKIDLTVDVKVSGVRQQDDLCESHLRNIIILTTCHISDP